MQVNVLYFGVLKELLGLDHEHMELPEGASVGSLLTGVRDGKRDAAGPWDSLAVAVNREYVQASFLLRDGDEVALLPPVSGGIEDNAAPGTRVAFYTSPIPAVELLNEIKAGPDGAVVVFDGIVRNNTRGRETRFLVYEAYEEMALKQMRSLAAEALVKFAVRDVTLVHRLGQLEIGETSVFIAVASAHRGAAFDAARWLIDTLKKTVPIWKKEHFVDGAVWADGDPFPEEIVLFVAPVVRG